MNLFEQGVVNNVDLVCEQLKLLPVEDQVRLLNLIRSKLHEVSPFKDEPVDLVLWVESSSVHANDYNPNTVAPPEMRLLERSIKEDGYTQPIVGNANEKGIEVIDGFHRNRVGKESKSIRERIHGYLPVTLIRSECADEKHRIASTIRHNRARGVHGVMPMTDIVASLVRKGWDDRAIALELGMDADEVLRFKQNCGLPELYKNHDYSQSW